VFAKIGGLRFGLDTFRHGEQPKLFCHLDDVQSYRTRRRASSDRIDKRFVDLERIYRQTLKILKT